MGDINGPLKGKEKITAATFRTHSAGLHQSNLVKWYEWLKMNKWKLIRASHDEAQKLMARQFAELKSRQNVEWLVLNPNTPTKEIHPLKSMFCHHW